MWHTQKLKLECSTSTEDIKLNQMSPKQRERVGFSLVKQSYHREPADPHPVANFGFDYFWPKGKNTRNLTFGPALQSLFLFD